MEKILVVDDDYGIIKQIEVILKNNDYQPFCFTSPLEALNSFELSDYDLIISDFYMPEMSGEELLQKIRLTDKYIPFIILTINSLEIDNAIKFLKNGADDCLLKPVVADELIFRIRKNIEEKNNKRILDAVEREKSIMELESKRMVNWKLLYAAKDIKHTEQLINLFNRTLNQAGGFVWLDILRMNTKEIDEENYKISKSLVELIIQSTVQNQVFFQNITLLSNLDSLQFNFVRYSYDDFTTKILDFVSTDFEFLKTEYNRQLFMQKSSKVINCELVVDITYIKQIIKELILNALKYSPADTPIFCTIERNATKEEYIDISVKNTPKKMEAKDFDGNDIIGIPYEYSELVFDLFYTINPFPTTYKEEEWTSGTGLYIIRKILKKHNGWIETANGVDYSREVPMPYIKFTVTLPCDLLLN